MNVEQNDEGGNVSTLDVLVIGAGFSGASAVLERLEQGITNFRVYE
ncbi:MAG: hypothetical protein KJO95_01595 [Gammaproteobacteria bacterium]|nr:hypothetical protein [Gammaproteobacteria bacterium]